MIGTDPFGEKSWSGSSKFFFETCKSNGILARAIGGEVPFYIKYPLMLKNLSFNKSNWKLKYHLDTSYYKHLTKMLCNMLRPDDFDNNMLQIGSIYNIPEYINGRCRCFCYNDSNLAQIMRYQGSAFNRIPTSLIDNALAYERNVYHLLDKIFTMSEFVRQSFIHDFDVPDDKVVSIGAGINLDEIPEPYEKNYDNENILFIGIDFYRKGGQQLLEAFQLVRQNHPAATLHIIGPVKLNIPTELSSGVKYYGFLSKKNPHDRMILDHIFKKASLFVMPSVYEPFGIAPLEAMVHQIPCILTNTCAFPEMIQPGYNGELVEVNNSEDLKHKIDSLLNDPQMLKTMGANARNVVLSKYVWGNVVKRFMIEYSKTSGLKG